MIRKVVSNLKNSAPVTTEFDSKYVLFKGHNGSGKSRLVHGVELGAFDCVVDAAGKDVKSKTHLNATLTDADEAEAAVLTEPNGGGPWTHVMDECMKAMSSGTQALCRLLLRHLKDDMPLELDYAGWDAFVSHHGSYRAALLEMESTASKAARAHRAKLKELETVRKYLTSEPERAAMGELSAEVAEKAKRASDLNKATQAAMRRFVKEFAPGIEAQMKRWVPEHLHPRLHILGNEIRLGTNKGAVPSGAESVILAMGLAAALFKPEESIYIFPDRAYDAKTLGAVMRVARTIPCYGMYIQSTVFPEDYDAKDLGWHIVDLSSP